MKKVLVIDDEPDILELIRYSLRNTGWEVSLATDGIQGVQQALRDGPDLILLDVAMPKIDGYETCRRLREQGATCLIPIIMLTGRRRTVKDKVSGMNIGADDYVTKPFNPEELIARMEALIRRAERDLAANPLTRLPGQISIEEEVIRRLRSREPFVFCHAGVLEFKPFNDAFGFKKGDEAVSLVARFIRDTVEVEGNPGDFIGHRGGVSFIFLTTPDKAEAVCGHLIAQFDRVIPQQYGPHPPPGVPVMRLVVAVVDSVKVGAASYTDVDRISQELYQKGVQGGGSSCIIKN